MNNKYALAFICLLVGMGIGIAVPIVYQKLSGRDADVAQASSDLRQLQLTVKTFSSDAGTSEGTPRYPKTLAELVANNYLTDTALTSLTDRSHIAYVPPAKPPTVDPDPVILIAHLDHKTALCTLSGHIQIGAAE